MSCSLKGPLNPMWRNAKLRAFCQTCGREFQYYKGSGSGKFCSAGCVFSNPEWRESQRISKKGKRHTDSAKLKMSLARKGKPKSESAKRAMTESIRKRFKNHVSCLTDYVRIRTSAAYSDWKKAVFDRDECTCMDCGSKPKKLDAHHIFPFAVLVKEHLLGLIKEEDIHAIDNGVTLCRACHKKRHQKSSPELRLYRTLENKWNKGIKKQSFGEFYSYSMEELINLVTAKLPPR